MSSSSLKKTMSKGSFRGVGMTKDTAMGGSTSSLKRESSHIPAAMRRTPAAATGGGAQQPVPQQPTIGAGGLIVPPEVYQTLDRAKVLRRDRDRLDESLTMFQKAIDLITAAAGHPFSIGGARIMVMAAETAQSARYFQRAISYFEQAYLNFQISNTGGASEEHDAVLIQTLWQWAVCCSQEVGVLNAKLGIVVGKARTSTSVASEGQASTTPTPGGNSSTTERPSSPPSVPSAAPLELTEEERAKLLDDRFRCSLTGVRLLHRVIETELALQEEEDRMMVVNLNAGTIDAATVQAEKLAFVKSIVPLTAQMAVLSRNINRLDYARVALRRNLLLKTSLGISATAAEANLAEVEEEIRLAEAPLTPQEATDEGGGDIPPVDGGAEETTFPLDRKMHLRHLWERGDVLFLQDEIFENLEIEQGRGLVAIQRLYRASVASMNGEGETPDLLIPRLVDGGQAGLRAKRPEEAHAYFTEACTVLAKHMEQYAQEQRNKKEKEGSRESDMDNQNLNISPEESNTKRGEQLRTSSPLPLGGMKEVSFTELSKKGGPAANHRQDQVPIETQIPNLSFEIYRAVRVGYATSLSMLQPEATKGSREYRKAMAICAFHFQEMLNETERRNKTRRMAGTLGAGEEATNCNLLLQLGVVANNLECVETSIQLFQRCRTLRSRSRGDTSVEDRYIASLQKLVKGQDTQIINQGANAVQVEVESHGASSAKRMTLVNAKLAITTGRQCMGRKEWLDAEQHLLTALSVYDRESQHDASLASSQDYLVLLSSLGAVQYSLANQIPTATRQVNPEFRRRNQLALPFYKQYLDLLLQKMEESAGDDPLSSSTAPPAVSGSSRLNSSTTSNPSPALQQQQRKQSQTIVSGHFNLACVLFNLERYDWASREFANCRDLRLQLGEPIDQVEKNLAGLRAKVGDILPNMVEALLELKFLSEENVAKLIDDHETSAGLEVFQEEISGRLALTFVLEAEFRLSMIESDECRIFLEMMANKEKLLKRQAASLVVQRNSRRRQHQHRLESMVRIRTEKIHSVELMRRMLLQRCAHSSVSLKRRERERQIWAATRFQRAYRQRMARAVLMVLRARSERRAAVSTIIQRCARAKAAVASYTSTTIPRQKKRCAVAIMQRFAAHQVVLRVTLPQQRKLNAAVLFQNLLRQQLALKMNLPAQERLNCVSKLQNLARVRQAHALVHIQERQRQAIVWCQVLLRRRRSQLYACRLAEKRLAEELRRQFHGLLVGKPGSSLRAASRTYFLSDIGCKRYQAKANKRSVFQGEKLRHENELNEQPGGAPLIRRPIILDVPPTTLLHPTPNKDLEAKKRSHVNYLPELVAARKQREISKTQKQQHDQTSVSLREGQPLGAPPGFEVLAPPAKTLTGSRSSTTTGGGNNSLHLSTKLPPLKQLPGSQKTTTPSPQRSSSKNNFGLDTSPQRQRLHKLGDQLHQSQKGGRASVGLRSKGLHQGTNFVGGSSLLHGFTACLVDAMKKQPNPSRGSGGVLEERKR